ncbi:MAG TPA: hypothetical protein VJT84_11075 [Gaiellaceae bacterium]|nr:hypothetical protein [Gaiellaceae bacterium]
MAARTKEEVKRELESERQRLGNAVRTLRSQGQSIVRRLPLIALGAAGTGLVARTLGKRVFHHDSKAEKRGRRPFGGRD